MPTIIDTSYFVKNVHIPVSIDNNQLQKYIDKYEPEVLLLLLGPVLYKDFTDALATPSPAQKWTDLRDGASYTDYDGYPQRWMGFKNNNKMSIIANYVYFHYMQDNATQTTATGEIANKKEAAYNASPAAKMSRAWHEMRLWIGQLILFLESKKEDYAVWQDYVFPECSFESVNQFGI